MEIIFNFGLGQPKTWIRNTSLRSRIFRWPNRPILERQRRSWLFYRPLFCKSYIPCRLLLGPVARRVPFAALPCLDAKIDASKPLVFSISSRIQLDLLAIYVLNMVSNMFTEGLVGSCSISGWSWLQIGCFWLRSTVSWRVNTFSQRYVVDLLSLF